LYNLDINIFRFFNGTCKSSIADLAVPYISAIGGGFFLFVLALILIIIPRRHFKLTGVLLMAGLTFSYNLVNVLKNLICHPRPFVILSDVNVGIPADGYSFPSNHAAMAFMAAYVLWKGFGRPYFFYSLAVLVGISRIYLGVHFPVDVFAGACLGLLIGHILFRCAEGAELYR